MKKILALLALALAFAIPAAAESQLVISNYDVDSTSYYYPRLCTYPFTSSANSCPGAGVTQTKLATTSGSASTTVTSVNTDAPFAGIGKGDVIVFSNVIDPTTLANIGTALRTVTAVASSNSITIDSNVTIPAAGGRFTWWKYTTGLGSDDGWVNASTLISQSFLIDITQISVTGGIDYTLECRHALPGGAYSAAFPVVAATNKTTTSVSQAAWSLSGTAQGPWDQCRVGLKVGSADDDGVTIGASSDDIDFKEYVNSYSIDEAKTNLDFVEDSGGTPKVCVADASAVPDPGAGAAWCTQITLAMNNAACTPDNTYSCTYSTTTHKFTIARATGTKSVDLLWNTGANVATSIGPTLGYSAAADDTGATTYASDSATGESAEKTASLTDALYISGTTVCAEVQTKMQAASGVVGTYSCAYDATSDKITISATGITQLMILWNSGTNNATSADTPLGFSADSTGALSYEGAALGTDAANEVEKVTITMAGFK